jgi:hypothetical protein
MSPRWDQCLKEGNLVPHCRPRCLKEVLVTGHFRVRVPLENELTRAVAPLGLSWQRRPGVGAALDLGVLCISPFDEGRTVRDAGVEVRCVAF